jgi:hypothetical protein
MFPRPAGLSNHCDTSRTSFSVICGETNRAFPEMDSGVTLKWAAQVAAHLLYLSLASNNPPQIPKRKAESRC